ncbi:MAG: 3-oxoadipyl-CoA thiolase [Acidimicrobiia bacterium]|nr:3-oxoadipyl-CoA thiolase [Acidimicrobiia bacterium]
MAPDAYIVSYLRTPIGRYGGSLAAVRTDDLAAIPIRALMERHPMVDPESIDDVILGATNQAGEDNRNVGRMALLLAGLPERVPGTTVNRLCGSGMQAVIDAARAIRSAEADLVIAGGVESMSRAPFVVPKAEQAYPTQADIVSTTLGWRLVNPEMERMGHTDTLGMTAEHVAAEYDVNRHDQDRFALSSQEKAAAAMTNGRLAEEIVPVRVQPRRGEPIEVATDEHPRPQSTIEALGRLKPAFTGSGTVTAGNASGINDGAAAMLIASGDAVERLGVEPIARIVASAVAGVPPRIMGIGPIPAVEKLQRRSGVAIGDVDVVELNEAFASQSLACLRAFGLDDDADHVNPNGGAIALGHPTGMSGARITGTAALELRRRGERHAIATMCIGVGQGIAVLLERAP